MGQICDFVAVRINDDGNVSTPKPDPNLVPLDSGLAYALIDGAIQKAWDEAFPHMPAGVGTMVEVLGGRWPTETESAYAKQRIKVAHYWFAQLVGGVG